MTLRSSYLLAISLASLACSSGSGGGGSADAGSTGGVGGTGAVGGSSASGGNGGAGAASSGGAAGGGTGGASGGTGGGTPSTWTVIENNQLHGVKAVTGHPTDPNTIAFLIEQSPSAPGQALSVTVATSTDSGKTFSSTKIMDIPDTSNIDGHGLVWDPEQPNNLGAAFGFPYGFDYKDLWRLATSTDGGKAFQLKSIVQLDHLAWDGGLLLARVDGQIQTSTDFGVNFTPVKAPAGCNAVSDFAHTATHNVFACGKDGIYSCQGASCSAATLPAGTSASTVRSFASDPARFVALGGSGKGREIYLSTDGGKSFSSVQALPNGFWVLQVDPRPAGKTVVVNDRASGHSVWRSTNAGATFADVTPPVSIPNTPGLSTYAYEVGITAGGSIVGYTAAGVLRLDP